MGLSGERFNLWDVGGPVDFDGDVAQTAAVENQTTSHIKDFAIIGGVAGVGEVLRRTGSAMSKSENTSFPQRALAIPVKLAGYGLLGAAFLMSTSKIAIACEETLNDYRAMREMDKFANIDGY